MIDGIIANLKSFRDKTLREDIEHNPKEVQQLVNKYFHCG
jgi:glutamine synthetase